MVLKTYCFVLDLKSSKILNTEAEVVIGDVKSSVFNIDLRDGINPVVLTNINKVVFIFKKSDDTTVVGEGVIIDALTGSISYSLGTQETSKYGKVLATVELYGSNNEKVTFQQFYFKVRDTLESFNAINSISEYSILNSLINEMKAPNTFKESVAESNVYTLDLSKSINFVAYISSTENKSIVISNVPQISSSVILVNLHLICSYQANISFNNNIIWRDDDVPSFTVGDIYEILLMTYNNGVTWYGSYAGAWKV